jgi:hypothetical protein
MVINVSVIYRSRNCDNNFNILKLPSSSYHFISHFNSNSLHTLYLSFDTQHANSAMTSREETVLAPIDPSITDENDWWEFGLTEVKVLKPGKMLYANLLEATEQNPVQVIGCLEKLPDTHEHLGLYRFSYRSLSARLLSHFIYSPQT